MKVEALRNIYAASAIDTNLRTPLSSATVCASGPIIDAATVPDLLRYCPSGRLGARRLSL